MLYIKYYILYIIYYIWYIIYYLLHSIYYILYIIYIIYYINYIIIYYIYIILCNVSCTTFTCHITSMIPLSKCLSSLSSLSDFLLAGWTPVAATKCQGKHQELRVEPWKMRGSTWFKPSWNGNIYMCTVYIYIYNIYIYIHNIIQYRQYDANPIFGTPTRIDSPRWATLVGSCWSLIFRERSVSSVFLFKAWVGSFGSSS